MYLIATPKIVCAVTKLELDEFTMEEGPETKWLFEFTSVPVEFSAIWLLVLSLLLASLVAFVNSAGPKYSVKPISLSNANR